MAEHLWGMAFEPPKGKPGYVRLMSEHRKPYKTVDGYIAVLPYLDAHWQKFCTVTGRTELIDDARFRTLADRVRNIDATSQVTAEIMATRRTAEWSTRSRTSPRIRTSCRRASGSSRSTRPRGGCGIPRSR
jgi:crotonobetainyl-CoA:carnitine CoA-transferase CaiB-like acyl-CoA transferase